MIHSDLTKENYTSVVSSLSQLQRVSFYELLAHNITIVVRVVWTDEEKTDAEKVEAMKWLNEIQHRVVRKIQVERLALHEWKEEHIIGMFTDYVKQCSSIGSGLAWAIKTSYQSVVGDTE